MGHDTNLVPNATLLIQAGTFFASWAVLHFLVFKPYLQLFHARVAKTSGLKEKALHEQEKAEGLRSAYEGKMKEQRRLINHWLEGEKKKISEEVKQKISSARGQAQKEIEAVRQTVLKEVEQVRAQLTSQIGEYSSRIVTKLLGKTVAPSAMPSESKVGTKSESRVVT